MFGLRQVPILLLKHQRLSAVIVLVFCTNSNIYVILINARDLVTGRT